MGACASTQNKGSSTKIKKGCKPDPSVIRVVHMDGRVKEFDPPICSEQILSMNPSCFLCCSDSMFIDSYPEPVSESEELRVGHLYFLLPKSYAHKPLSLDVLCELAIKALFDDSLAHEILHTPILQGAYDTLWWPHTSDGSYSVKSGYRNALATQEWLDSSSSGQSCNFWNRLWRLKIHPRLKSFIWRMAWGIIPVRMRLRSKGLDIETKCGNCGTLPETVDHLFSRRKVAQTLWYDLNLPVSAEGVSNTRHWLSVLMERYDDNNLSKIVYGMEVVWSARNSDVIPIPALLAERTIRGWEGFKEACIALPCTSQQALPSGKWVKPSLNWVKINFDASVEAGHEGIGLGFVILDHDGKFLHAATCYIQSVWPVSLAEVSSMEFAMVTALAMQYDSVILEGDCKSVILQVQSRRATLGPTSSCITRVITGLSSFAFSEIVWTKQTNNGQACAMVQKQLYFRALVQ